MTENEVRQAIVAECKRAGSQNAWAKKVGVSGAFMHDVILGKRAPGSKMLLALGLRKEIGYFPIEDRAA